MARILLENVTSAEIKKCIEEVSKLLGIGHLLHRKPRALSGGQRQRVVLGRAIFRRPRAFLFDEPLSNLDAALLGRRIRTILRDYYDKPMILGIRPEDISPHQPPGLTDNTISATVNIVEPIGIRTDVYLTHHTGQKLIAGIEPHARLDVNDKVKLYLDLEKMHIFEPSETGRNVTLSDQSG